ncbi:MAG: translesion error-prone DNA polymerase V autoproteolytic subunit [Alphaproteobacteria bacterium]|nr:translesion error-prone DNA polymerase V autoproteolytic subunit [Alphaproteobacteria bacterium]
MVSSFKPRKRKPGAGRKPNSVPTQAIRLPAPLVHHLLDLKKRGELESFYPGKMGKIFAGTAGVSLRIPLFESRVQAGFPSPGDDYSEGTLDLNDYLIPHKATTFFVRVTGESMTGAGIFPGDMLIVDRSLNPSDGKVVIAVLNGEMTVKRLKNNKDSLLLCSENDRYPDIKVTPEDEFSTWGVVTNVIHSLS